MTFDDFMEDQIPQLKSPYYPVAYTGLASVTNTLAQELYDREQYDIRKEHIFMEDSFEMFEMIMEEENAIAAALFLHEQYKVLHAERAKLHLLDKDKRFGV